MSELLPYEIWDKKKVRGMAKGWKDPVKLIDDPKAEERDRHWRLIKGIYSLIEGSSVLDVACGMGHLYALCGEKCDYLGIDSSEYMIQQAKEFFPQDAGKFQVGTAYDLSGYPIFDTVVASGLILHLPDPVPVLRELWSHSQLSLVFSAWVNDTPTLWKTKQSRGKYIIQRSDTLYSLRHIVAGLGDIESMDERSFRNPYEGESNYLFKVVRRLSV